MFLCSTILSIFEAGVLAIHIALGLVCMTYNLYFIGGKVPRVFIVVIIIFSDYCWPRSGMVMRTDDIQLIQKVQYKLSSFRRKGAGTLSTSNW